MNLRADPAKHRPARKAPPTLAVRADQAADSLGISQSTFLALVAEGLMPKAISIPNHRGLALYDFKAVENAWQAMVDNGGADNHNPFDD